MSFGRNPHVPRAEAAEEKARNARDTAARVLALREAANQWERASQRERDPKRAREYEARANSVREEADSAADGESAAPARDEAGDAEVVAKTDRRVMN